jgi:hypothetical protein
MNDELTPQEKEAFANLPRERMPAGLEDRVVGAMQERGFIAPRRARVVRITNSRVAGLLAACVVLVVGAYSIGLHRGSSDEALRGVRPPELDEASRFREIEAAAPLQKSNTEDVQERSFSTPEASPTTAQEQAEPERSLDWKLETTEGNAARAKNEESKLSARDGRIEAFERTTIGSSADALSAKKDRQDSPSPPTTSPGSMAPSSSAGLTAHRERSQSFLLNGTALIVEAPDSVRVVQDEQGRVLLIYTSDGIIRIRLAD